MNLNTSDWKEFKIGDFFNIKRGKRLIAVDRIEGPVKYFSASQENNGLTDHISGPLFTEKNALIYTTFGDCFYIEDEFTASDEISIFKYDNINKYNALFIATVINQNKYKYAFGRKAFKNKYEDEFIKLPIKYELNEDGSYKLDKENNKIPVLDGTNKYSKNGYLPDWTFMEEYIKSLNNKPISTQNKKDIVPELNVDSWQEFRIGDLFNIKLSKGDLKINEVDKGSIPLVSSGDTNNGIVGYIDENGDGKAEIFNGNVLTLDMFGKCYYQQENFYAVSHGRVNILEPKFNLNVYNGLFIANIVNKEQYRFSYGRAVYSNVAENIKVRLPVLHKNMCEPLIDSSYKYNKNGYIPDFDFMERYIKSLPYSDRI